MAVSLQQQAAAVASTSAATASRISAPQQAQPQATQAYTSITDELRGKRRIDEKRSWAYVLRSGVAGGVAGCVAKTAIAPLDRVKILFQANNPEFAKYSGRVLGVFYAIGDIFRSQGPFALFQGHSATLVRIFPYAAIKYMAYDKFHFLLIPSKEYETSARLFLAGSASGVLSVFVTYPLELIRVRLAYETKRASQRHGIRDIVKTIYTEGSTEAPFSGDARRRTRRSGPSGGSGGSSAGGGGGVGSSSSSSGGGSKGAVSPSSILRSVSSLSSSAFASFAAATSSVQASPSPSTSPSIPPSSSSSAASTSHHPLTSARPIPNSHIFPTGASSAVATALHSQNPHSLPPSSIASLAASSSASSFTSHMLARFPLLKFYRGFTVTVLGMIPYAGTSFVVFGRCRTLLHSFLPAPVERAEQRWYHSKVFQDLTAGGLAGAISQTAAYPFEVIRRRQQVGGVIRPGAMLGMRETAVWIWQTSGWRGFYVGLSIGFLKVVPMTSISFAMWLGMKRWMDG
ncbi:coenzyme A transporter [Tilletia horrida]|nr:coenzyme A transporter [Tilletia horrida]